MDSGAIIAPYLLSTPTPTVLAEHTEVPRNNLIPLWLLPRGERYIGMWQADQRHGPGVMVTQAGVCYQGTFQADKMVVSGVTRVCPELPSPCAGAEFWSAPCSEGPDAEQKLGRGGWGRKLGS